MLRSKHQDNITKFDKNFKFYLLNDKHRYILAVNNLEQYVEKIKFFLNGVIISRVTDNISNNLIVRKSGEREIIIDGNRVVSVMQNIKLKALEKPIYKKVFREKNIHKNISS